MKNNKRAKRQRIQRFRLIAEIVCIAVLVVTCGILGMRIYTAHQRNVELQGLQELYRGGAAAGIATPTPEPAPDVTDEPAAEPTAEATAEASNEPTEATEAPAETEVPAEPVATKIPDNGEPVLQDDFKPLLEINPHLVGWLDAGPSISLPIVQSDNEFYLDHDFYGKNDKAGTVFANADNVLWPKDKHILLHGHNMRSGSIFGTLDNYRDLKYLKEHPVIYFRTIYDAEPTAYVPVALFDASMDKGSKDYFEIGHIWFEDDAEFVDFANKTISYSVYVTPFDVQADDNLMSLITCSYSHSNGRFMMVCREMREDETAESVAEMMQLATKK